LTGAAAAPSHPNILAIHDVGREETTSYAVMELLDGETLRQRLSTGPLPVRKAVEFGVQISRALAASHGRGIVHRDLKPENVFVAADGHVKVLDLGLAKVQDADGQRFVESGNVRQGPTREGGP
jgi:serine/threonine-protein kinase